jgi:hypothetical protein
MATWYAIHARAGGAEIAIYDEIGAYGVSAKGFLAEIGGLPDGTPIDLRLNSPGGSVFDAGRLRRERKLDRRLGGLGPAPDDPALRAPLQSRGRRRCLPDRLGDARAHHHPLGRQHVSGGAGPPRPARLPRHPRARGEAHTSRR